MRDGSWSTLGCAERSPATAGDLQAAMERIDRGGRADHPDSYAGLEVDEQAVRAVVYRVPSTSFDDFVRRAAGDSCILVRDAAHSWATLAALQQRITDDLPHWAARGVRISTVGARHDGTGVEVGTQDLPEARTAFPERYGDAPVILVQRGPVRPMRATGPARAPSPGG